jgi:hypothetical protein
MIIPSHQPTNKNDEVSIFFYWLADYEGYLLYCFNFMSRKKN